MKQLSRSLLLLTRTSPFQSAPQAHKSVLVVQVRAHLHLSVVDRAVYFHLIRHSRLEGNCTVRFSILKVARNLFLSHGPVRESARRLVEMGVLRLIERTKTGHLVEPRLPEEIRSLRGSATAARFTLGRLGRPSNLEKLNFMKTRPLRQSIHTREDGNSLTDSNTMN